MISSFDDFEVDDRRFLLRQDGQEVPIEPQVFDVLLVLLAERDRVVTKEELLDQVWGDRFVSESTLTSRIKALRRAVGDDGRAQRVVRTVHGRGYQFIRPVEERESESAPEPSRPRPALRQEIRFATAADGVRLAYAETGSGPPLVKVANWLSHLDHDAESVVWRHWLEELSARFHLLRYDERGRAGSDWDVDDFSVDAWVNDLEVVVEAAGLDRFPMLGISQGGPVAIRYAVRHPERVSHLILLGSFARGRARRSATPEAAARAELRIEMVRVGWGQDDPGYRRFFASRFLPEGTQEQWQAFDDLQRVSTSAENAWRFVTAFSEIDVTDDARQVRVPTLIACARREPEDQFEQSRELASLIPASRLVPLDSANHLLPADDPAWPTFLTELDDFLALDKPGSND